MNDVLGVVTALALDPEERTTCRALIDLAQEELAMSPGAAVRYAVGVRRQARYDQRAAQAAEVIAVHSPYYIDLREEARTSLSLPLADYMTLTQHRRGDRFLLLTVQTTIPSLSLSAGAYTVSIRTDYILAMRDVLNQLRAEESEQVYRRVRRRAVRRGGQHDPAP